MKTILLLGELGKKFGRKHRFDVKSPAEAIRALVANFPAFERYMIESKLPYKVVVGKAPIAELDDIHNPSGDSEAIKIVPVLVGAGGNGMSIGMIVLGVALVAAAFFTGGASIAAAGFLEGGIVTTFWGGMALGLGSALILGGTAQLLAGTPKTMDMSSGSNAENNPSYAFNGPANVSAQGNPVPIGYGRMVVGSAVISAGIVTEEY